MSIERLRELEEDMRKCFRCSLCKMIPLPVVMNPKYSDGCPANREFIFHAYSGSGKSIMALSLLRERVDPDQRLTEITNACTSCGCCDVACKFIMEAERQQINIALREHLVDEGFSLPVLKDAVGNMQNYGHIDGPQGPSPGQWAEGLGLKILPEEKAEVLLFAGQETRSDPHAAAVARKFARLLLKAGIDFGILGDKEPNN